MSFHSVAVGMPVTRYSYRDRMKGEDAEYQRTSLNYAELSSNALRDIRIAETKRSTPTLSVTLHLAKRGRA